MKKKAKPKKENSERWLLTYSDLITLLMILFILLFAMSTVDKEKFEALSSSLSSSMGKGSGVMDGSNGVLPGGGTGSQIDLGVQEENQNTDKEPPEATSVPEAAKVPDATTAPENLEAIGNSLSDKEDMANFEKYIEEILKDLKLGVAANTAMSDRGLSISFKNDVFFDSGKDTLKDEMKNGLGKIAELLNKVNNPIIIEGHTDNVPISKANIFASNWQLSAARAANVAQYLVEVKKVDGSRISAVGYGEYHPIASNSTVDGRSKNRRVDIIILYNDDVKK